MANTFWQAVSDTVQRAVNLRVVTVLGDAAISGPLDKLEIGAPAAGSPNLVTDINIVGGDITTIVSDKLLGPDYADLRAGHAASVTQAQAIVERNANILATLFKALGDELKSLPEPSAGPVRAPAAPAGQ